MASIRKRRGTRQNRWTVDYRDAGGRRRRLTAKSQAEAEEIFADKIQESRRPGAFSADTSTRRLSRNSEVVNAPGNFAFSVSR